MKFSHPLARRAKLWQAETLTGEVKQVLVIETTLELEHGHKKFKHEKVDRLREAAKEFVMQHFPVVNEVLLMNPSKA